MCLMYPCPLLPGSLIVGKLWLGEEAYQDVRSGYVKVMEQLNNGIHIGIQFAKCWFTSCAYCETRLDDS